MTDQRLEDRLRSELPQLADALVHGGRARLGEPRLRRRPIRPALAAAAAVAVLGMVAVLELRDPDTSRVVTDNPTRTTIVVSPTPFGTWRALPDAPIASRSRPLAGWIDGEVVVLGGSTTSNGVVTAHSDGAVFDSATDTWRTLPDQAFGHPGAEGFALGSSIIATAKNRVYRLEVEPPRATAVADLPADIETVFDVVNVGDEIWVVGTRGVDGASREILMTSLDGDEWRPVERLSAVGMGFDWSGRPHPSVIVDGSEIIVDAGMPFGTRFDTSTSTWTPLGPPPIPGPVTDAISVVTDSGVVAFLQSTEDGGAITQVATFDAAAGWTVQPDRIPAYGTPTSRLSDLSAVAAGEWVVLLGEAAGPLLVHPPTGRWHDGADAIGISDTTGMVAVWTGTELVLWGGEGAGTRGAIWTPPSTPPASVDPAAMVECVPPVAVAPSQGLVGIPIADALAGSMRPGYELGELRSREVRLPESEAPSTVVVAAVRKDGRPIGSGIWLSPDPIASFGGDVVGGDALDVERWKRAPWAFPEQTNFSSANDVAEAATVWNRWSFEAATDVLERAAVSCGGS